MGVTTHAKCSPATLNAIFNNLIHFGVWVPGKAVKIGQNPLKLAKNAPK